MEYLLGAIEGFIARGKLPYTRGRDVRLTWVVSLSQLYMSRVSFQGVSGDALHEQGVFLGLT